MSAAKKPVIGMLGAPGAGKSFVAGLFKRLGCGVIDADAIAREVIDIPEVREELTQWWGDAVLREDGRIDRRAVGAIVFNNSDELARLESVIHPYISEHRAPILCEYEADPTIVAIVEDVPLLLEKGLESGCDVLVMVDASRPIREERVLRERGWDGEELSRREKNQLSLDIKRRRADHVIQNDGEEAHCLDQVRQILSQVLQAR